MVSLSIKSSWSVGHSSWSVKSSQLVNMSVLIKWSVGWSIKWIVRWLINLSNSVGQSIKSSHLVNQIVVHLSNQSNSVVCSACQLNLVIWSVNQLNLSFSRSIELNQSVSRSNLLTNIICWPDQSNLIHEIESIDLIKLICFNFVNLVDLNTCTWLKTTDIKIKCLEF